MNPEASARLGRALPCMLYVRIRTYTCNSFSMFDAGRGGRRETEEEEEEKREKKRVQFISFVSSFYCVRAPVIHNGALVKQNIVYAFFTERSHRVLYERIPRV